MLVQFVSKPASEELVEFPLELPKIEQSHHHMVVPLMPDESSAWKRLMQPVE